MLSRKYSDYALPGYSAPYLGGSTKKPASDVAGNPVAGTLVADTVVHSDYRIFRE